MPRQKLLAVLFTAILFAVLSLPALPGLVLAEDPPVRGPFVGAAIYPSVRSMRDASETEATVKQSVELPLYDAPFDLPQQGAPPLRSPASRQPRAPLSPLIAPGLTFKGLDYMHWGTGWPSDQNGDVGPNHYIQTVNNAIGIFDKTGARLKAVTLNEFFEGTNTPCDDYSKGDPIVLYDALADRWLITDMSWTYNTGPYYQCLALSAGGDPLGDWYQWGYPVSYTRWNDYSKLSVWTDGYYMSANMFQYFDSDELNVRVWAFDRISMLSGGPLRVIYFDLPDYTGDNYYASLLPANLRGPLPPPDSPAYFAALRTSYTTGPFRLWEFNADWEHPENSTFTYNANSPVVPSFSTGVSCNGRECIPQPDTGKQLHSIHNKLMMQLQYRNFGGHEALWANHTVEAPSGSGGRAAVRWYEIRNPGGTPNVYQSGTFDGASDAAERWMGSLAVDGQGNMALGYSAASSTLYPSIRYTGRAVSDTLNTLRQEITMTLGSGSQTTSYRWGDYTAMTVDPADDCTFWYTNQIYTETNTSIGNWQTRVGSFKFNSCRSYAISGTVYNAATLAGVSNARISATDAISQLTVQRSGNNNGAYAIPLKQTGVYTLSASAYGYQPAVFTRSLTGGLQLNIPLTAAPTHSLIGAIQDARTGYPLQADIAISGVPHTPPAPYNRLQSLDDGVFAIIELPEGISYTLIIQLAGYKSQTLFIGPLNANRYQDINLEPDLITCNAPGYEFIGLKEDFETWPPPNWTIHDFTSGGNGLLWNHNRAYLDGNYTGGDGFAATVNSDRNNGTPYKTALRPPALDLSAIPTSTLTFLLNYQDGDSSANRDNLDVSINLNDGSGWQLLQTYTSDQGELYNVPGTQQSVDLSAYAAENNVGLSWYYNTDSASPHNWYAQIDRVRLGVCRAVDNKILLEPVRVTAESCPGCAQSDRLRFINHSGFTDTAVLTYTASPSVTVSVPNDLGLYVDGWIVPFTLTAQMGSDLPLSHSVQITLTAYLENHPAYSATVVIKKRIVGLTFTPRAAPIKPRSNQALAAANGYLYQIGGTAGASSQHPSPYVYRYSPADETWISRSPMLTAVHRIDAAVISNTVYIPGGLAYDKDGDFDFTDRSTQIYTPAADTWTSGAPADLHRSAYALAVADNLIYRIGGESLLSGPQASVDLYNPLSDTWNTPFNPADAPWPLIWPCAGTIKGQIYLAGGQNSGGGISKTAVYSPAANSWNDGAMADLPVTLYGAADFVLNDILYCAGGVQNGQASATVWAYNPADDTWTRQADLSQPRHRMEGVALNGLGYVENGWDETYFYSTAILESAAACPTAPDCSAPQVLSLTHTAPVTLGLPVYFTAAVTGTAPITYNWNFGGPGQGSALNTAAPVFTYTAAGTYTVALSVSNVCGSDSYTLNAQVTLPVSSSVPLPVWNKTVYRNTVKMDESAVISITNGDILTVVDKVYVSYTDNVTFTLTEKWDQAFILQSWPLGSGSLITQSRAITWQVIDLKPNVWRVLSKTFAISQILSNPPLSQSIVETLWVQHAQPETLTRRLDFSYTVSIPALVKVYLPLILKN